MMSVPPDRVNMTLVAVVQHSHEEPHELATACLALIGRFCTPDLATLTHIEIKSRVQIACNASRPSVSIDFVMDILSSVLV